MSYILDTHTLLWFIENDVKLSNSAKSIIESTEEAIYLSVVSLWEIAIKVNIGKLKLSSSFETLITYLQDQDIHLLPIGYNHMNT